MKKTLIIIIAILSFALTSVGQKNIIIDYGNPKEYEINKIEIIGIQYLSTDALINIAGIYVGQKIMIPGKEISGSIKNLWKQGLFSDISISISEAEEVGKINLTIFLQEQPRLHKVFFTGINKSQTTDLEEDVDLRAGRQITDNILNNTKNQIQDYYTQKGFPNVEVDFKVVDDTTMQNMVNLHIDINKNNKIRINKIVVRGNTEFSDKKIRRIFKETKQKSVWVFWKQSKYIDDLYEADKKTLIDKYNKEGYRDARILEDSVYVYDEKTLNIYLKVHEGHKYYFRDITWVGNTIYTSDELSEGLDIEEGDVYNQERLESRLMLEEDAVGNRYLDDGYLFYNSQIREVFIENDSIDIQIVITEGQQATINRIIINGNTRTNDHVVIREIRTLPGALFSKSDIIRSVRELAQLGNFDPEQLVPVPIPHQQDGTVDIEYNVVEKSNDMFELSGGYGMMGFVGRVGLRFNNFSVRNIRDIRSWSPLPMGDGQQLSISANIGGSQYQLYSVSFMEPWLGGKKPNSLSVSLYYNLMSNGITKKNVEENPLFTRQTMQLYGLSVGLGKRLQVPDDYFILSGELSYQRYQIQDYRAYINIASGAYNIFSLNGTFARNSIDNPLYSRHGSNLSLGLKATPPYSLLYNKKMTTPEGLPLGDADRFKWVEHYKVTINGSWFFQIVGNLVINTRFEYGLLGYYNKNIGYSPFEGYVVGGDGQGYYTFGKDMISLRGYENKTLTPDYGANTNSTGHLYSKYTVELRHPVILKEMATIYMLGFIEGGNCWNQLNEFDPFDVYRSAGVGVRVFLPMLGMLGIDFGYGFDEVPFVPEANGWNYHLVFGQQL